MAMYIMTDKGYVFELNVAWENSHLIKAILDDGSIKVYASAESLAKALAVKLDIDIETARDTFPYYLDAQGRLFCDRGFEINLLDPVTPSTFIEYFKAFEL